MTDRIPSVLPPPWPLHPLPVRTDGVDESAASVQNSIDGDRSLPPFATLLRNSTPNLAVAVRASAETDAVERSAGDECCLSSGVPARTCARSDSASPPTSHTALDEVDAGCSCVPWRGRGSSTATGNTRSARREESRARGWRSNGWKQENGVEGLPKEMKEGDEAGRVRALEQGLRALAVSHSHLKLDSSARFTALQASIDKVEEDVRQSESGEGSAAEETDWLRAQVLALTRKLQVQASQVEAMQRERQAAQGRIGALEDQVRALSAIEKKCNAAHLAAQDAGMRAAAALDAQESAVECQHWRREDLTLLIHETVAHLLSASSNDDQCGGDRGHKPKREHLSDATGASEMRMTCPNRTPRVLAVSTPSDHSNSNKGGTSHGVVPGEGAGAHEWGKSSSNATRAARAKPDDSLLGDRAAAMTPVKLTADFSRDVEGAEGKGEGNKQSGETHLARNSTDQPLNPECEFQVDECNTKSMAAAAVVSMLVTEQAAVDSIHETEVEFLPYGHEPSHEQVIDQIIEGLQLGPSDMEVIDEVVIEGLQAEGSERPDRASKTGLTSVLASQQCLRHDAVCGVGTDVKHVRQQAAGPGGEDQRTPLAQVASPLAQAAQMRRRSSGGGTPDPQRGLLDLFTQEELDSNLLAAAANDVEGHLQRLHVDLFDAAEGGLVVGMPQPHSDNENVNPLGHVQPRYQQHLADLPLHDDLAARRQSGWEVQGHLQGGFIGGEKDEGNVESTLGCAAPGLQLSTPYEHTQQPLPDQTGTPRLLPAPGQYQHTQYPPPPPPPPLQPARSNSNGAHLSVAGMRGMKASTAPVHHQPLQVKADTMLGRPRQPDVLRGWG